MGISLTFCSIQSPLSRDRNQDVPTAPGLQNFKNLPIA